jgi:hypothetical protein
LLPLSAEDDYYFFESRSYAAESGQPLSALAARWATETFGDVQPRPYISTGLVADRFITTVSFGVGENPNKRVADPFEQELLAKLPRPVLIDKGAGGEEAERVERAVAKAGPGIAVWGGSFAGFAEYIARSRLYVGYDSAGGHVASACGIPLVSVFAGFASARSLQRWHPPGAHVVRADDPAVAHALVRAASTLVSTLGITSS